MNFRVMIFRCLFFMTKLFVKLSSNLICLLIHLAPIHKKIIIFPQSRERQAEFFYQFKKVEIKEILFRRDFFISKRDETSI